MKCLKILYLGFFFLFFGCVNQYEIGEWQQDSVLEVSDAHWNNINLIVGYFSVSGEIYDSGNIIEVDESVGIENFQVITYVDINKSQNPEYLRVIYTSDRIEWVSAGWESSIFKVEEDCLSAGYHCDAVVPGEGVSGVFQVGSDFVGVTNTWCSSFIDDYTYEVNAYVIDMSGPDPVRVSDIATIKVECIQL